MSSRERTGTRDLTYSQWHRAQSLRRFIPFHNAHRCTVIDIDFCEYCHVCSEPLALIETQRSSGPPKSARIMSKLSQRSGVPAFSVSYKPTADGRDIEAFAVRQISAPSSEYWIVGTHYMTPVQFAEFLWSLRSEHGCVDSEAAAVVRKGA